MLICPDCKHKTIGYIHCPKCGSELYRRHRHVSAVERFAEGLDRVLSNSVYTR